MGTDFRSVPELMDMRMLLEETIKKISPLNKQAMEIAIQRQANLTKPPGSLGLLENFSIRLAGIKGEIPEKIRKKAVILCAGDHGVVEEGISAYPQEVTTQMLWNFISGKAAINVLARHIGAEVLLVNAGVKQQIKHPAVIDRPVKPGTGNIAKGPAMSRQEAIEAIELGIEVAERAIKKGAGILATGDMGIGNTTPSTAIISVLTEIQPGLITGRGTGLDDSGLKRKVEVIEKAIRINQPDKNDPIDVLAKIGGFEIGALAGVILAAAANRVPVVIDGLISTAAALLAVKITPLTRDYLFPSHLSEEPGHQIALKNLKLEPYLLLKMRLGEGTGAVLGIFIIESALKILREMATFEEAGVSREKN